MAQTNNPPVFDHDRSSQIDHNKVMISVRDLHKSFGDREVLKGISFDVYAGETKASLVLQVAANQQF